MDRWPNWDWITISLALCCLYVDFAAYSYCTRVRRDDRLLLQLVEQVLDTRRTPSPAGVA